MELAQADQFFATARERYRIKLARDRGEPYPWSQDPAFNEWRFCNVFRENDKTTTWFRENIRGPLSERQERLQLVQAVVIFRWFNRISTGEIIKDLLLNYTWTTEVARDRLKNVRPLVTGAFMIKTLTGYDKLEGLLESIRIARIMLPAMVPKFGQTLEGAWNELKIIPYLGPFMSHEVVQDLAHTFILSGATDKMTWTNFGPGGTHGMGRIISGDKRQFNRGSRQDQDVMREAVKQLLEMSKDSQYWDQEWPAWDAHTVEFWSCEWDKICRARNGEQLKRKYP